MAAPTNAPAVCTKLQANIELLYDGSIVYEFACPPVEDKTNGCDLAEGEEHQRDSGVDMPAGGFRADCNTEGDTQPDADVYRRSIAKDTALSRKGTILIEDVTYLILFGKID